MFLLHIALLLQLLLYTSTIHAATPQFFNVTAISAANGASRLECWQLDAPLISTKTAGGLVEVQQMGDLANGSWTRYSPHFTTTAHPAPHAQWVAFLSGVTTVRIPNTMQEATFYGSKQDLMIAADTADLTTEGHITTLGAESASALQIPLAGGKVPLHKVLYEGACLRKDLAY